MTNDLDEKMGENYQNGSSICSQPMKQSSCWLFSLMVPNCVTPVDIKTLSMEGTVAHPPWVDLHHNQSIWRWYPTNLMHMLFFFV